METRSVTLRILGDDRSAKEAVRSTAADADWLDNRYPTLKIRADSGEAKGTIAGLRAAVADLTGRMHDVKFGANGTAFDASLAKMMIKLQALQAMADRPIISDKALARSNADLLSLTASFEKLIAKQQTASRAAAAAADGRSGFPILGNRPGTQDHYGAGWLPFVGNLPSVSLFGGIAATSGLHILIDSAIELAAKLVPATVAAVALTAALGALAPTAEMIYQRETNIYTATDVLGQQFPLLTEKLNKFGQMVPTTAGSLSQLNREFRPGVIQIWGDALTVASSGAGTIQKLLTIIVPWLDKFAATLTVDMTSGSDKFLNFVKQGVHDLGQFGQLLAPLGNALSNLMKVANQTHIADDLMVALTAGSKLIDLFSKLPAPILVTLAALHGTYVWGGLAVTGLSKIAGVLGAIPGLGGLKALNDIPGLLDRMAAKGLEASAGIQYVSVKGLRGLAVDAEGAEVKTGLLQTSLAALTQIPVWGWVAAGTIAVTAIGLAFLKTKDASQQFADSLNKGITAASNANVFNLMASDIGKVNDKIRQLPGASQTVSNAMQNTSMSAKDAYDNISSAVGRASARQQTYSDENKKILGQMNNFGQNVGYIMKTFGVSYPEALAIATQAGVKLTDNLTGSSKAAQVERQQIFGLVEGLSQLQGPSGLAGKDFEALAYASNDITNKIGQLNSAWHQWLGVVTGGQTALDTFAQGMDVLNSSGANFSERLGVLSIRGTQGKAAIDSLSDSGIRLNQSFMQEVMNADDVIASLRSQDASQQTLEKSTKAMVAQLLPFAKGSKEATSVLYGLAQEANYTGNNSFKSLADWAGVKTKDALKILKGEMDQSTTAASNLANTVQNLLTTDFQKFVYVNSGAQAALKQYTTDLLNNTDTTRAGRNDRQTLINDLMKTGLNAKQAQALVDGLSSSLGKIPKSETTYVQMSGKGQYSITGGQVNLLPTPTGGNTSPSQFFHPAAHGMFVTGGTPGRDSVPILAMAGEAVVPPHLVPPIAPYLKAHGVPGFAAGGIVGGSSGSFSGSLPGLAGFTGNMIGQFEADMTNTMVMGMRSGLRQALQMLQGVPVANVGSGVARWAPLVRLALAMEGLSPDLILKVLFQMQTESGGNPNAINLSDSNAAAGDPSRGLLQTIMSTFIAYHWPGTSWNIYDPLANIAAAINYARHVYGPSLMSGGMGMGSGHGYAMGGIITEPIWGIGRSGQRYTFGETGYEMVTPLNRVSASSYGGSGGDIYITVQAGDAIDPNAVAQAIHLRLRRYKQLKGGASLGLD